MNKTTIALFGLLYCLTAKYAFAQDNMAATENTYGKRAQAVFMELGGNGVTYSFNYDTRFNNRQDGIGGRAGLSYFAVEGNGIFTLPVVVNYLLGKDGRYFEMGLGATYIGFSSSNSTNPDNNSVLFVDGSTVIGTMTFGYRRQPEDGGFLFRVGVSPIFGSGSFIPWYPYIGFGYAF